MSITAADPLTVTQRYRAKVAADGWQEDPSQLKAARALDAVRERVSSAAAMQDNGKKSGRGFFSILRKQPDIIIPAPRGCYIYGSVGRGKTMLMDMLTDAMPAHAPALRCHFHSFMRNAHTYMKQFRSENAVDPVQATADMLCGDARLLCFDEFQIFDIADAMLLHRLFEHIFSKGIALTATSNTRISDLYKDGLQREHILPFIALLETHCHAVTVETPHDYRTEKEDAERANQRYFLTSAPGESDRFTRVTTALAHGRELRPADESFSGGRTVCCGEKAARILYTDFHTLCDVPLGAGDYNILASRYVTFVFRSLPGFRKEDKQAILRLIHLVDILYERRRSLYCLADYAPADLYRAAAHTKPPGTARLCSRLHEMQSADYAALTSDITI